MLATDLLERNTGIQTPFSFAQTQTSRLLHTIQPAPHVIFDGKSRETKSHETERDATSYDELEQSLAHRSGVNALCIERFEGRYFVSAAANGDISMWDLDAYSTIRDEEQVKTLHRPVGSISKSVEGQAHGSTGISFYPFDSLAFLASSYDHTVKLYDSTTLSLSASFDLESVVYSHSISPVADHLLIACATQHPAVRLADLRTGTTTHSLAGHGGAAILSVAWSPANEHILASGASDGGIHIWDIRRSVGSLGVLDMEDSVGVTGDNFRKAAARDRHHGKAHMGPVNGLSWTGNGRYLVSAGHDERIRVWDISSAANTLANFGPVVRNADIACVTPLIAPQALTSVDQDIMFFPNGREILMCELYEGQILKRLKAPALSAVAPSDPSGQRNTKNRVVGLGWRAHHIEMFSAHADGSIRSWRPHTSVDAIIEDEEQNAFAEESESRKRKRQTLDDIYREITAPRVTFT